MITAFLLQTNIYSIKSPALLREAFFGFYTSTRSAEWSKRADKNTSARSFNPERSQTLEDKKIEMKTRKRGGVVIISVVSFGHFSGFFRSSRLFVSVISVVCVGHLGCLINIKQRCFPYLVVNQRLGKSSKNAKNRGEDHFAGKEWQNKGREMSVYSTALRPADDALWVSRSRFVLYWP